MQALLKFSKAVDWLNAQVGKYVIWLILASTVISAVNAVVRKAFNISSNAYLEVQWYLFAAAFLLAAGYTLLNGEHVQDRRDLQPPVQAQADLDRHDRLRLLPHAGVFRHPVVRHSVLPPGLPLRRDVRPTPAA